MDFSETIFLDGNLDFSGAQFSRANLYFEEAIFGKEDTVKFVSNANFNHITISEGHVSFNKAKFNNVNFQCIKSEFEKKALFKNVLFNGVVDFTNTQLKDTCVFEDSIFLIKADFKEVVFVNRANFKNVKFGLNTEFLGTDFSNTQFDLSALFEGAEFKEQAIFEGTKFGNLAGFRNSAFEGNVSFKEAVFDRKAIFTGAKFILGVKNNDENSHEINFRKTHFYEDAEFSGAAFEHKVLFESATFEEFANFEMAKFETVFFRSTKFEKDVKFNQCEFLGNDAFFNNVSIKGSALFKNAKFNCVPLFTGMKLSGVLNFSAIKWRPVYGKLEEEHNSRNKENSEKDLADIILAWGQLKVEMNRLHMHEEELDFFAKELEAKSQYEGYKSSKTLIKLFNITCDYGKSISKPFIWLLTINFIAFLAYLGITSSQDDSFFLTLTNSVAFLPTDKIIYSDAINRLIEKEYSMSMFIYPIIRFIHMSLSLLFIFLIGLGIRNQLRIR
ncbi:MAG: pentapeptide repeat-containing protein [Betaproteobacteria bacterium]|nr:pentapeptide repeat-containing protein [Betaproteobacteria bacterium]